LSELITNQLITNHKTYFKEIGNLAIVSSKATIKSIASVPFASNKIVIASTVLGVLEVLALTVTTGLRKKLAAVNILQFLSFVEPFELPF